MRLSVHSSYRLHPHHVSLMSAEGGSTTWKIIFWFADPCFCHLQFESPFHLKYIPNRWPLRLNLLFSNYKHILLVYVSVTVSSQSVGWQSKCSCLCFWKLKTNQFSIFIYWIFGIRIVWSEWILQEGRDMKLLLLFWWSFNMKAIRK